MVYVGGRYDNEGRKRRTDEEVMTMDVDTALKDRQAASTEDPKPKRTTRSGAKAKLADACPNPTHDDFETLLINGDPVVPSSKAKTKKKAWVTSKPYVEISGDEGAPANPSTPVVPAKTRLKSRAAKKAVIDPSDDEDEIIELPKDPEGSGMVGKGKRKQQDNSVGGAASEHQPKRPRPTPRQRSIIDADVLDIDTLEDDVLNTASPCGVSGQTERGERESPCVVDDAHMA